MCLVVSGVSMLIHLYSVAYMTSDEGFRRFFCYLNFFVFSMLLLILAGNFVLLIVGWAFVGFASYALISFWYRRGTATTAGMKAFVINVIGDVGLVLAAFLLFRRARHVRLPRGLRGRAGRVRSGRRHDRRDLPAALRRRVREVRAAAAPHLAAGRDGGPDAGLRPDPCRDHGHRGRLSDRPLAWPLFKLAPTAADIAAFIGLATLIFAATVALVVTDLKRIIAYSTMSQIGYMIVGVSIGAYSAGLFHLMTHAFFKALLFMSAGSIIAAMAGAPEHRRDVRLPQGDAVHLARSDHRLPRAGGLPAACPASSRRTRSSASPSTAAACTRGWAVGGYAAAFLTAFYSFRIGFRVVAGDPARRPRSFEGGHLAHGDPENPATGEREDTDVGFPGPEHHIAEREWPMKIADGDPRRRCRIFGGVRPDPGGGRHRSSTSSRAASRTRALFDIVPSTEAAWIGLAIGGVISIARHRPRLLLLRDEPRRHRPARERLRPLHTFLINKWYFDELYDWLVYRPVIAIGRFCNAVVERVVVNGLVSATIGVVRGFGGVVRGAQSGFVRAYALLAHRRLRLPRPLLPGGGGLMLNILLWLPLAVGLVCLLADRRAAGPISLVGALGTLGLAIALVADFDADVAGLQHVVDESWIPDLGVRYQLGIDGISLFLVVLTAISWVGAIGFSLSRQRERERNYYFLLGSGARRRRSAPSSPRTCCSSSSSST